jgi:hypothetical protein
LIGPIVGCVAIQWLTTQIGTQQTFNSNLVLGAILVGFVLLVPRGIVPSFISMGDWLMRRWQRGSMVAPGAAAAPKSESKNTATSEQAA